MAEIRHFSDWLTIISHNMGMAGNEPDNGTPIDLQRDNIKDPERQVDASAYALAGIFGPVSLPPGTPTYVRGIIEDRAINLRRAAKESGFLNAGPGDLIDGKTKDQREHDHDEAVTTYVIMMREEERERAEWAKTESTVAGVKMTGKEWEEFAERLRTDEELRRRVIAKFESRGMTEAEANARYDRVEDMARIAGKPPSQRSEEEAGRYERGNADPACKRDMRDTTEIDRATRNPSADMSNTPATNASSATATQLKPDIAMVTGPAF